MVLRISHPNTPTRLLDLGPAHADPVSVWRNRSKVARLPLDEAIEYAASHGHVIGKRTT